MNPIWLYPEFVSNSLPRQWGHSAVYSNSKMYIYGGCRGGLQSSEVIAVDIEKMMCNKLETTGRVPGPCDSHAAVVYNKYMIVFGGTSGSYKTNHVHVLNLDTHVWSRACVGSPAARESHTLTMISDKHALVFGGSGHNGKYLNDVHLLDCKTMTWTSPSVTGITPTARDSHSSVVIGNCLVVYGGDCGDRYLSDVDVLNLKTFTWSKLVIDPSATNPGARAGHAAVAFGTKMYVFGGVGERTYYSDVWVLDIELRVWTQLAIGTEQPQGRFSHVAVSAEDGILIYGGCGEDKEPLDEFIALYLGEKRQKNGIWSTLYMHNKGCTRDRVSAINNLVMRRRNEMSADQKDTKRRKKNNVDVTTNGEHIGKLSQTEYKILSEVHGVVDGVFESGYLMTAHLNGQVLRGVLFNQVSPRDVP